MLFQRLSTSNTFSQWVAETQRIIPFVNELTNGYGTIYANTNISVGEDLYVNGNVLVTGTFILDEIDFDDLTIAGNLTVDKVITAANGEFLNLNVVNNVATVNVTTNAWVGQDAFVYGNLTSDILNVKNLEVQGNAFFDGTNVSVENVIVAQNIQAVNTTTIKVGTDGLIYGELTVGDELSTVNLKSEFGTLNAIEVTGNLYVTGEASLDNVTSVQNVATSSDITTVNLGVSLVDAQNLQVNQNVSSLNVTGGLFIGTDAFVYGNFDDLQHITAVSVSANSANATNVEVTDLTINENVSVLNVTNDVYVGADATIYNNLYVSGTTTLENVILINIQTANITNLIGSANTQIYNTIDATTAAVTVASNIGAFTGFILALG